MLRARWLKVHSLRHIDLTVGFELRYHTKDLSKWYLLPPPPPPSVNQTEPFFLLSNHRTSMKAPVNSSPLQIHTEFILINGFIHESKTNRKTGADDSTSWLHFHLNFVVKTFSLSFSLKLSKESEFILNFIPILS